MTKRFLFVGEQPSETAYRKGWTWKDGRLAAATLFGALSANGIDPHQCGFVNLFGDTPTSPGWTTRTRLKVLAAAHDAGVEIVAMGQKVSRELVEIPHRTIRHPAARGAGRAKEAYRKHVWDVLCNNS